jgi:tetraacyldisaccharide 4'-kinase
MHMRPLLLPLVPFYGAGVTLRNVFFDAGVLKSTQLSVPVISVGNLSAGGTGKTPLVELLARRLAAAGRRTAIISRGYKRESSGTLVVSNGTVQCADASAAGDEPAQMAAKLTGTVIIVDEHRVRGAEYAIKKFGVNAIVLDDGFQHRYLKRDIDILVLPAAEIHEPGWLLPAGDRREPLGSIRRASIVAISRCESLGEFEQAKAVLQSRVNKPVIGMMTKVTAFRRASSRFSVDLAGIKGKSVLAFSGIGNPSSFERAVTSLGLQMKRHVTFADHHHYGDDDLRSLERMLAETGADVCVTTEKDVARLSANVTAYQRFRESMPLFYVEIEQSIISGEKDLNERIGGI